MRIARDRLRISAFALTALAGVMVGACSGTGPSIDDKAGSSADAGVGALNAEQRRTYDTWKAARTNFDKQADAYWADIERKKEQRRDKRRAGQSFSAADFVMAHPPRYTGPELPADIARIIAGGKPAEPDKALPGLADYLASAKQHFGYVPARISEAEFKRRYAEESLSRGLTRQQVVRVYALETGGNGTYDMQAGIHPLTRQGRPISSALGYAQLLAGNTVNELVKHGDELNRRLLSMAAAPGTPNTRVRELQEKSAILKQMVAHARSVPNEWSAQVRLGNTAKGMGLHALNLDPDIGPWLQVIKLAGLKDLAAQNGRPALAPNEIELMNLAGPRTGLEMMEPPAASVPTANFFSRGGYERNSIVRQRTAAELLKALDERMDANEKNAGAIEFGRIFDTVTATLRRAQN
jgi:hypothetical protein